MAIPHAEESIYAKWVHYRRKRKNTKKLNKTNGQKSMNVSENKHDEKSNNLLGWEGPVTRSKKTNHLLFKKKKTNHLEGLHQK